MPNNFDPTIDVEDSIIRLGDSVQLTAITSVFDQDGNPFETYRFYNPVGGGFFSLDGVDQGAGSFFDVDASEIAKLRYHAGATIGKEDIRALVFDGGRWSSEDSATFYSVTAPTRKPEVTTDPSFDVTAFEKVKLSGYFSATDPDGYPIIRYKFKDSRTNNNGGQLETNGIKRNQGQWVYVPAQHLDTVYYHGALNLNSENILVRAYDGTKWSTVEKIEANTTRNANRPIVSNFWFTLRSETSVPLLDTIVVRDEDNSTLKKYRFLDTKGTESSGYIEVNGTRQPSNTWVTINASDMPNAKFVASDTAEIEKIRVRVWDGRFWSKIKTIEFNSLPDPTVETVDSMVVDEFEAIPMTELVLGQTDDGPQIVDYEFIDMNTDPLSGFLYLDGSRLDPGVIHNVTREEFEESLEFVGGANHLRSWDQLKVRANNRSGVNNFFVGEWKNINVFTEPNAKTCLIDPDASPNEKNSWHDWLTPQPNGRLRLTYSFLQGLPLYFEDMPVEPKNPLPVPNSNQRSSIRTALSRFSEMLNVDIVEVSDNFVDPNTGTRGGIIRFGTYFDDADDAPLAFVEDFPNHTVFAPWGGDIWINNFYPSNVVSAGPDSQSFLTILHEIGHAFGMQHPHQIVGPPKTTLSAEIDHDGMTVMSYVPNPNGTAARNLMTYDAMYLGELYGFNETTRAGDDTYSWNAVRFSDLVYDANGIDTIDASNQTLGVDISLQQGQYSSIGMVSENVAIAHGTIIENAIGTRRDDTISGNEASNELRGGRGNDILTAKGGADIVYGGRGDDTYIYEVGDNHDIYDEEKSAGRDILEVRMGNRFGLDSFTEDLAFRRLGRDLIVEFKTEGDDFRSGSVAIKDQLWGGSRIETLRMYNDDGSTNGVSIDLTSVFVQSGTEPTSFEATSIRGQYGYLVSPV